jgi:hypothetical protein
MALSGLIDISVSVVPATKPPHLWMRVWSICRQRTLAEACLSPTQYCDK